MPVDPISLDAKRVLASLKTSGYPHALDDEGFHQITSDAEAVLPAIFSIIETRLHAGGFPVASFAEVSQVFARHPRLCDVPDIAIMPLVELVLPERYPETGFNFSVTRCEIAVSRSGHIGPKPSSVRTAQKNGTSADAFLTGRAETHAKLYYLWLQQDDFPYTMIDCPFFDLASTKVSTVLDFLRLVQQAAQSIRDNLTSRKTTFDLTAFATQGDLSQFIDIARAPSSVPHCGENHRLISLLCNTGHSEGSAHSKAAQVFGLLAVNLYDLLAGDGILCLPEGPNWESGDRWLQIRKCGLA